MHGKGTFVDARLDDPLHFPVAARAGFGHVRNDPDLITAKLPALQFYQLSIPAPMPPPRQLRCTARRERARRSSTARADCATCHVPPLFTEPGWNMHTPAEIGIDDFQSSRVARPALPHDAARRVCSRGRRAASTMTAASPTLRAVVEHYNQTFNLNLGEQAKKDLIEYLKSL